MGQGQAWLPQGKLRWAIYFGFWTLLGLLNAASAVIEHLGDPNFQPWEPLLWEMSSIYTTAMICPGLVYVVRRYPLSLMTWYRLAGTHLTGMVLFSLAHTGGMVSIRKAVYGLLGRTYDFSDGDLLLRVQYEFYKDVRLYWIIVFLALGFFYYNKYREQQLEASQLETRLIEAELENLKNQLNPHFFFNTLNMISSFVYRDPDRADEMISRLSELLRLALQNSSRSEITLREELAALELYLEIMRARFERGFEVNLDLDPGTLEARVPSLILQPLVENSFRHGLNLGLQEGAIEISSHLRPEGLELSVRDNGSGNGSQARKSNGKGIGLSNTKARLRHLYGEAQSLQAGKLEPSTRPAPFDRGGFEVVLVLPFKKEAFRA